ncbi:MAG: DUF4255 domain-containing protein [Prolixibacteraceae bacterium]|jgi:hypothetical protein
MIHTALTYIRDILNENFKNEFSISENKVVLSNIVKADGSNAQNVDGKIVFFLVSLDEEATLKNNLNRFSSQVNGSFAQKTPTLHLNMQILFCANFDSSVYIEGLSYLSALIRFFQVNRKLSLEGSNSGNINKLSFELCKLDYAQLSHLWSAIGSKLMPSVLYKVGMLVFDDAPIERIIPAIKET